MIIAQLRGVRFTWRPRSAWGQEGWYPWDYTEAARVWQEVEASLGFAHMKAVNRSSYASALTREGKDFRQRYVDLVPEGV